MFVLLLFLMSLCGVVMGQKCANGTAALPPDNRCAILGSVKSTSYFEDEVACQHLGGHLLSIQNAFANAAFVEYAVAGGAGDYVFLGADNRNGTWKWIDGRDMNYTNWAKGQPTGTEKCLSIRLSDGKWFAANCHQKIQYACEVPVHGCATNWTWFDGNCYMAVRPREIDGSYFWKDAQASCEKLGANLVSIHSDDENTFLVGLVHADAAQLWIGLSWNVTYSWTDGSDVDYLNVLRDGYFDPVNYFFGNVHFTHKPEMIGIWGDVPFNEPGVFEYICKRKLD